MTYVKLENQLANVSKSFEESNYHIKFLEDEISKYKEQMTIFSQMNQNQRHNHENGFSFYIKFLYICIEYK